LNHNNQPVEQFVKHHGGEIIETRTESESESGKKDNRPELDKAIRRCLLTGATLIMAKLDRLSRDIAFIANLQKSKVDFTCCDMPEANTLTIGMMAVLAQYERELISERTKEGLAAAKARGTKLGNPHLHLVRNSDTTAATQAAAEKAEERNAQVRELITKFEAEAGTALSLRKLAQRLNDAGYTTARGKQFRATQVPS
jgi:DNA invertase Pin-like site-specific DNA recombinase